MSNFGATQPIAGVSSAMLLEKMQLSAKTLCSRADLLKLLEKKKPELLLTMGAGDIDGLIDPIIQLFKERESEEA